jgi:thiol-disulfide isomerase/thioredoxin
VKLKRGVMPAAEFAGLEWVNADPIRLADLRGRVVLVHFWDQACVNCLRTMSYVKVWHGRYGDKGLAIIGIHAPEFEFGRSVANVRRSVEELGLEFPVALDNDFATWYAYSNRFWPASYLIDREGFLSDYGFGEGGYQEMEASIQALLREGNPHLVMPKVIELFRPAEAGRETSRAVSPEVYLGYRRGRIGNAEGFGPGEAIRYVLPSRLQKDVYYADGMFLNHADCLEHAGDDPGRLVISYEAADVYAVVAPREGDGPQSFVVEQDGMPLPGEIAGESVAADGSGLVAADAPRLFHLVRNRSCARHVLTLRTSSPGLRFYCISFVACSL